uniref:Uncharacterized protein n=1 Tax=Solibacter usitatus (strain Ellin6076) TaxID=234267 RepID=Q029Y2_SOLUE
MQTANWPTDFACISQITTQIQVLLVAGGWLKLLDCFRGVHIREMARFAHRRMILLIDFDGDPERLTCAQSYIPENLKKRVFIVGVWTEPEDLKAALGSYENIGLSIAKDCH